MATASTFTVIDEALCNLCLLKTTYLLIRLILGVTPTTLFGDHVRRPLAPLDNPKRRASRVALQLEVLALSTSFTS